MSKSLNINVPQIVQTRDTLNAVPSGSTATPDYSVKYVPQDLTEAQKAQARQNIGAAAEGETGGATINEFHYLRDTTTDPATYYIDADGYEPQEGDLMTIVWDWPFRTDENDPDAAFKNPATLKNNSTNPSIYIKNANANLTTYDEIDPEVNTRWTVRLVKENDVWYAYNISTLIPPDWNTVDSNLPSYIKNKPTISGGSAAEIDKYWTVKITAATTMTITGTVNNVWQNGTALTPVNDQYSLAANSVIRIDAGSIQLEFADTTSTDIYVWVPKNVTLSADPLPSNSNATLMYAAAGTETFTTQATVVILNNKFWVNAIDCRKLVLLDASKADLSSSKQIEWFVNYAQILVSVNDLDRWIQIVDSYAAYIYSLGRTTNTYDGYLYVDYTLKTVKFSAMPLRLLEDTRFAIIVYSDVTSDIYIDNIDYVFNNGECTYNKYTGNTNRKQIVPGKNVITFSSDTSGEDVHHRIDIANKAGNYTVIRKYSRGYTGAIMLDGDNYTGKIVMINGLNNNLHQEGGEGWEFPTGSDINYYNMCNHWATDGTLYGNMIMADTDFPTVSHTPSAIPTTTDLNAIYVPKSRKAAFVTYLTTLYDGLDITPMTNKIVEYDFLNWMDDHTPQVIILPTV